MRRAHVVGAAMNSFGSKLSADPHGDGAAVLGDALDDAGLALPEVDLVVVGVVGVPGLSNAPSTLHRLAWTGVPTMAVENASATGSAAIQAAIHAVQSGAARVAAAVGIGSLGALLRTAAEARRADLSNVAGTDLPPIPFALMKAERMNRYGESAEDALHVVEKNLRNASRNPKAQRSQAMTFDELREAPMWVDPLRFVEACPIGDGAAAVVISAEPVATRPVIEVLANVHASDRWNPVGAFRPDPTITGRMAREVFELSGRCPADVDVVEVHEAFSVEELQYIEDIGLAAPGEAVSRMRDGEFSIGGRVAVSPSGGLIGRGHPGGATGVAQWVEIVDQLRGESGERQHPGAEIGFATMIGAGGVGYATLLGRTA